jgi:hypothetical protein
VGFNEEEEIGSHCLGNAMRTAVGRSPTPDERLRGEEVGVLVRPVGKSK